MLGQVPQHTPNLTVSSHFPEPDLLHVRERHHDRHAVGGQPKQIEPFEAASEGAGADVLDRSHALGWVNYLLANPKELQSAQVTPAKRCYLANKPDTES